MAKVKVTLKKSTAGHVPSNRRTIAALGLKKIGDSKVFEKTKELDGALRKIHFLVTVKEQ
ncbi:MAG: 50S ribosomal protein L30 [bacterium]